MENALAHISVLKKALHNKDVIRIALITCVMICILIISTAVMFKYNHLIFQRSGRIVVVIGVSSAIVMIASCIGFSLSTTSKAESFIWLAILAISAVCFSLIFPAGSVPDETYHYLDAYAYANLLQGIPANDHATNMRMTDVAFLRQFRTVFDPSAYDAIRDGIFPLISENDSRYFFPTHWGSEITGQTPPQTRIPAALGIIVAQILHLNGVITFYMGRAFNFACFAVLAFFAVRMTPIAKPAFMTLCLLPGVLHIVSSYSYDALIFGLSFLLTALCLKCFYASQDVTRRHLIIILILIALLSPCKSIYSALTLLVLFIPSACFSSKRDSRLYKASAIVVALGSIAVFSLPSMVSVFKPANATTPALADNGAPAMTRHSISELITSPAYVIYVYLYSIIERGTFYLSSLLGGTPGWFHLQPEIAAPWLFLLPYIALLFISAQRFPTDRIMPPLKTKLLFGTVCLIVFLGASTAMFVASTYSWQHFVEGLQGRYLIPTVLLFLLMFRVRSVKLSYNPTPLLVICIFGLNQAYLQYIFTAIGHASL